MRSSELWGRQPIKAVQLEHACIFRFAESDKVACMGKDPMQVVVFGDINADLTMDIPFYPAEGDDSTAQALRWGSGGTAVNAAATFALLGARVRLVGRVGNDLAADIALQAVRVYDVDLNGVQQDNKVGTGLCSVMVSDSGERTFFAFRGANVSCDPAAMTPELLSQVDLLYLSAYVLLEEPQRIAALRLLNLAFIERIPVVLDLALPPIRHNRDLILSLLPRLWLISMNEDELGLLFPEQDMLQSLDSLLAAGVAFVALKRGAQGCLLASGAMSVEAVAPTVIAVDTNGCGDAFAAACTWGLLHRASLPECARLSNLLGALTATRPGAADALPTREELREHWDFPFELPNTPERGL